MKSIDQLIEANQTNLHEFQKTFGHSFNNIQFLIRAITHRSFVFENQHLPMQDNETLEFLGDAVLDLAVGSLLFTKYPEMAEGELTKLRAALVQESHLAIIAQDINLGNILLLGKGEENSGGRHKPSILSCAYEAIIGAVFIDSSYDHSQEIIYNQFAYRIEDVQNAIDKSDAKSKLQEITQQEFNQAPTYVLDKSEGPDHDKTFTISVHFRGSILATATAKSKKAAEQKAAEMAIANIDTT